MKILCIILGIVIFFMILAMLEQLQDIQEYQIYIDRMNKAIEYIEKCTIDDYEIDYEEILEILKGEDK